MWNPYDTTVTINEDWYCVMLENFLQRRVNALVGEHGQEHAWFQQDGATAHTVRRAMAIVRKMLPGHVVSLRDDIRKLCIKIVLGRS